ncbi:hypothetical protein [Saccharothrix australiensis]|uniref:Excreted virulence factor EspC (Type VII ESX diderm) n=1 Tax=Saccharothrix australiensis TaxID=2072 RepID=A0A495W2F7_9PSEU|nr:hypothetical protein [Saccharothrix australiensis]RKT55822.1 hypothetical protein C8E97_4509 [Saccharothrix australiensis]
MGGYEVDLAGLRKAAAAAASAGEQAGRIGLGDAPRGVPGALPGSEAAATAPKLADAWDRRLAAWSAEVAAFAAGLSASADRYATDEAAAARDFSLLGGFFGGAG